MDYRLTPPEEILETTVQHLPLSKSISARALLLNTITRNAQAVDPTRVADCLDTRVLASALALRSGVAHCADCGTAARFLTAFYAGTDGVDITLDGSERLRRRPIAPLVEALRSLGADIEYAGADGCLPLHIRGRQLAGGTVRLDASASSQFASALALMAPTMAAPLVIDLGGEIPSMPYLLMTLRMLANRGVEWERQGYAFHIANTPCRPAQIEAEGDWSAAAFWYAIAGVSAGWVTLPQLRLPSLQGDAVLSEIGERFGVITAQAEDGPGVELSATPDIWSRLDMDMADYPDLVAPLAVTAALIGVPFVFSGVANLRHKESDRLAALVEELDRIGIVATASADTLQWEGERRPVEQLPVFDSHNDHRIAMAFAPVALFVPGIIIRHAEVVEKSYPHFWEDLAAAGFTVEEVTTASQS